jgi:light-harvesting complex 1 alpha chain
MPSRSAVRTNAIIFSVLGLVVGLLIHFIVLSSSRYNWIDPEAATLMNDASTALMSFVAMFC